LYRGILSQDSPERFNLLVEGCFGTGLPGSERDE
jgi:hypothetical protein